MAMEAIKGAGMTYQGSVSSAESQPKTDSAVKAAETDATEKGIVSENIKQAGEENVNTSQGADQRNTNAQIKKAVDEVNKKAVNSEAIFGIHEATNRVTIKIIDKDTKKVLKEIPPEKTLDMIAKVWELAGLMVDEKDKKGRENYANQNDRYGVRTGYRFYRKRTRFCIQYQKGKIRKRADKTWLEAGDLEKSE